MLKQSKFVIAAFAVVALSSAVVVYGEEYRRLEFKELPHYNADMVIAPEHKVGTYLKIERRMHPDYAKILEEFKVFADQRDSLVHRQFTLLSYLMSHSSESYDSLKADVLQSADPESDLRVAFESISAEQMAPLMDLINALPKKPAND